MMYRKVLLLISLLVVSGCATNSKKNVYVPKRDHAKCYTASQCVESIRIAISDNWSRPESARNGLIVMLDITLSDQGYVNSLKIAQYSGNPEFDFSTLNAIRKAAPFSELSNLDPAVFNLYFKKFKVRFRPEDLAT